MSFQHLYIETFPVGPLQCNCTIIGDFLTKKAIVIDPGGDEHLILKKLADQNLTLVQAIHTHAHFDHFLASEEIRKKTGASLALHKEDLFLWKQLEVQCHLFGIPYKPVRDPDFFMIDNQEISVPACPGFALHTPGHTPGSMSFYFPNIKLLVAGDTLFKEGIGRTDLWGGDHKKIQNSIKEKLFSLDDETTVITGHGDQTKIGHEKAYNSFIL